ncbi:bifunctional ADP-dependent NAD(P)H-hydrate dehydratase/NAD(P)H-hydrate epimerase [Sulfodiicoccus acidiphilus]|uniref:Bifunctional NAD(P)H-hydrate repair enzyme n=1 Tax=Sulfodiicoccus acidiphilus TaxID=1670455 RepID=A0A348B299_9CREN|nr:NAD(P)H-hydrate dehydratase [Sulfodiicoccus acidiphilus]BBD72301.1 bifunctional ADP-dependent NAD(P)H-hydrate dehydratase/NAD(P)H-hydrate epimerase [Sulfodiicoccus acidiphilus]GGT90421.1 bifunctional ADP-dependent NAD(P)H-hydrate dehydratase/NAD(P)H-hydrate epimerase [Sulfodiicoccus acidiphilus]
MISTSEMRVLEVNSQFLGVPTRLLMENAGRAVAAEISNRIDVRHKEVVIFVGHGGKGGDGLVTARFLAGEGAKVKVVLTGEVKHPDAAENLRIIEDMDFSIDIENVWDYEPREYAVAVDALLGTGLKAAPKEPLKTAIRLFNETRAYKVSIDLPSGMDPDSGMTFGDYVVPNLVIALHDVKGGVTGNFDVVKVNIGIPPEASIYVGPGDVLETIKPRSMKSKKGDFGRVLVIGGNQTFSGAPTLASLGALRTGADLVYTASPEETAKTISTYSPDLISIKLTGKELSPSNVGELTPWIERVDAIVLGPGLGVSENVREACELILEELRKREKPAVIDADALKVLRGRSMYKKVVVTPHAGEFKIFFGKESGEGRERIVKASEAAKERECVLLLKGYFDVITDGERFKLNKSGNPGMAVGGTGDVLTGIVAALMARKIEPFKAAYVGAFINGVAGSLAHAKLGDHLTASDLVSHIPEAIRDPLTSASVRPYRRVLG